MEQANVHTSSELFTLQLPSKTESIAQLEQLIEEIADKYHVAEDTFANMMTCLNEAAINAIIHGNKLDETKKVIINAEVEPKRIVWTVTDEGPGFDYTNLADPTSPENLENLTGRGVFIIKHLADQCIFNASGNTIELHFKI
ncbi:MULTISPECIES: ATP-binding protein [Mucilaginibacter]|uniref:Serine/threonine-protein kinase RsbW n=1 Tax=Mucilaginibacter lappiensis TaxID=354630 RepID=A0A1N6RSN7_9SPHI|nr:MULTISPECIES: ATP-binding protein [Mucilaginibacter]MBB6108589.1 serine/threonine-protein kinase RsbW [Mucilaginibacter lappiensis]MBB6129419.1 serine/threonine-protein kinase RsbW [Mucilaginibacter lappiensis]NHA06106.1 ATP-binding protein [Mucilaginibacter inviolabilis]SIQ31835.1 serine/threonine-protein kinase RsbW [Mucilaginibacter lappiensis]